MNEIIIKLIDGTEVPGIGPLVLIGPNGSGKSRMAATLSMQTGYQLVSALRNPNIYFESMPNPASPGQLPINYSLPKILTEFLDEENWEATSFTQRHRIDPATAGSPPVTKMSHLIELFGIIFPGRKMTLGNRNLNVSWTANARKSEVYSAAQMSDGERAGIELIARLLRADKGVVIIDEPEVHLHPLLAREFWTRVESFRPDCRFVYITHDLPFALSRVGARIGIVRNEKTVQLIDAKAAIPEELVESLLGAATVSVVAKKIVFCEGKSAGSFDQPFYSAWFHNEASAVAPIGSCERVRHAVSSMKDSPLLLNAEVLGIVDRDYWPESYLDKLKKEGIFVLPFHELESLLCLKEVASAIGRHFGQVSIDKDYDDFLTSVRASVKGFDLTKLVIERSKREFEVSIIGMLNSAKPAIDLASTKLNLTSTVFINKDVLDVGAAFDRQQKNVQDALAGAAEDLLRVLPGKHCLTLLSQKLGMAREKYIGLIQAALREAPNGPLERLHSELVQALQPHLPPRS